MTTTSHHSWDYPATDPAGPHNREKTCSNCQVTCRRYGHGRGSYYGYQLPGHGEVFLTRVPACGDAAAVTPPVWDPESAKRIFEDIERQQALLFGRL